MADKNKVNPLVGYKLIFSHSESEKFQLLEDFAACYPDEKLE